MGVLSLMLGAGILGAAIAMAVIGLGKATAQPVREYTLEIVPTDIDYGGGAGQAPNPFDGQASVLP